MSNFAPKLNESTDEEIWHWINESSPNYASLASDELTRRGLNDLQKSITNFNKQSSEQTVKMISLTRVIIVLTVALFVVALFQVYFGIDYKKQCADFGSGKWECTTWTDYGFFFGTRIKTERNF